MVCSIHFLKRNSERSTQSSNSSPAVRTSVKLHGTLFKFFVWYDNYNTKNNKTTKNLNSVIIASCTSNERTHKRSSLTIYTSRVQYISYQRNNGRSIRLEVSPVSFVKIEEPFSSKWITSNDKGIILIVSDAKNRASPFENRKKRKLSNWRYVSLGGCARLIFPQFTPHFPVEPEPFQLQRLILINHSGNISWRN